MATYKKRGDGWQARVRRKPHAAITRTFPRKAEAERWAADTEAAILAGRYQDQRQAQRMRMLELCTWYRATILPNRSETNTDAYKLKSLEAYFGPMGVLDVTPWTCVDYAKHRLAAGFAGDTVRRELGLLSDVFTTAQAFGYVAIAANPVTAAYAIMRKLRTLPPPVERERRLRAGEEALIMDAVTDSNIQEVVAFALIEPLREGELQRMRRDHINWAAGTLRVWKSKTDWMTGKQGRTVPLLPRAREILQRQPLRLDGSVWGFTRADTMGQAFRRLRDQVGIQGLRFHDLRHEATSRLFDGHWGRQFSMQEVAVFTGHRDWKSLKRYTHPDPAQIAASA